MWDISDKALKSPAATAFVILSLFMCSCGRPSQNAVRKEFLAENPKCTVLSVLPGEGDGSATYIHIKYKKPGSDRIGEDVWQYLKAENGEWRINHKETLNP
jgi:hypothetical protein